MGLSSRRTAHIGLGGNLGDRAGAIAAALRELDSAGRTRVTAVSRMYESEPVGPPDQPAYANAVARIEFEGGTDSLLALLQRIERGLGRAPGPRWGPRPIDLDILLVEGEELHGEALTVPHPRMLERDFVVTPLLEIDPSVTLPDGTSPSRERATRGRVTADLGPVPGYGPVDADTG